MLSGIGILCTGARIEINCLRNTRPYLIVKGCK